MHLHWAVDPTAFTVFQHPIRWYGICFALGFLGGFLLLERVFRREGKDESLLDGVLWLVVLGTLMGARLAHCLFYQPEYYLSRPLEILMVWQGGLASHGGALGIFAALYIAARRYPDLRYIWLLDRVSLAVPFAGACVRVGNFFNSEIIGVPTGSGWGVWFANVDSSRLYRHPAQLYESLCYFLIFIVLNVWYWRKKSPPRDGVLLGVTLTAIFSCRILIEFVKERQAEFMLGFPLSMGQVLSIPVVLLGLLLLFAPKRLGLRG